MIYGNKKNRFTPHKEAVGIQGHDFNENASESNEGAGGTARQNIVKWTAQAQVKAQ